MNTTFNETDSILSTECINATSSIVQPSIAGDILQEATTIQPDIFQEVTTVQPDIFQEATTVQPDILQEEATTHGETITESIPILQNGLFEFISVFLKEYVLPLLKYFRNETLNGKMPLLVTLSLLVMCLLILTSHLSKVWERKVEKSERQGWSEVIRRFIRASYFLSIFMIGISVIIQARKLFFAKYVLTVEFWAETFPPAIISVCLICFATGFLFSYAYKKFYTFTVFENAVDHGPMYFYDFSYTFVCVIVMPTLLLSTLSLAILGYYFPIQNLITYMCICLLVNHIIRLLFRIIDECIWFEKMAEKKTSSAEIHLHNHLESIFK